MRGLYAIVDTEALAKRGLLPVPFAECLLAARPAAIQLRDKVGGARRTLELLRAIAPLAARAGVPLFANDRPDLALLAGCDGVHVGQDDEPPAMVRALAAREGPRGAQLRVGVSTHDAAQVAKAIRDAPDYIAVGPIFATASKADASPVVGLDALRDHAVHIRAAGHTVVAIGGISLANAAAVGAVADAAAMIGALLPDGGYDAVYERARALHAAICGGSP